MMWRYERNEIIQIPDGYPVPRGYVDEGPVEWSLRGETTKWRRCRLSWVGADEVTMPLRGYCGLAGATK